MNADTFQDAVYICILSAAGRGHHFLPLYKINAECAGPEKPEEAQEQKRKG